MGATPGWRFREPCVRSRRAFACAASAQSSIFASSGSRRCRPALAGINELLAHRGPDGIGTWAHSGSRRVRAPAPRDHRPRARRPADDRRRRELGHLQRRDLQLPRAPAVARRAIVHDRLRHRGDPPRVPSVGARLPRRSPRDVRVRALGRGARAALVVARDRFGIKPLYYAVVGGHACTARPRRRRCSRSCRRSRPTWTRSGTTSPSSSRSAARRCSAASTSCCPRISLDRGTARHPDAGAGGRSTTSPTPTHTERYLVGRLRELLEDSVEHHLRADVAGRRLPQRRPRLEHRHARSASRSQGSASSTPSRAGSTTARGTTSRATPARSPRQEGFDLHESTIGPGRFRRTRSATSSTTSTTRSPGPGSFPQYVVSRDGRAALKVVLGGQGGGRGLRRLRALSASRTSSSASRRRSRGRCTTASSSSPTSRSSRNLGTLRAVQADDPGVLARGRLRRPRRALLPAGQPLGRARGV